ADVFLSFSTDGGATWTRMKVNDDATPADQWQPAMAVNPSGNALGIFWYDRRLDIHNSLIDRFGVVASIGGSTGTFGPAFAITHTSCPAVIGQDPGVKPDYMGDYDVAVADDNAFYVPWGDNRLADMAHANQPDVRFARIPINVNPLPSITNLSTPSVFEGSPAFTLTVNGSGFISSSSIRINGNSVATNFLSATQLTTMVPASLLADEGAFPITVFNPPPGGGTSNSVTFTVQDAPLTGSGATLTALAGHTFTPQIATFTD